MKPDVKLNSFRDALARFREVLAFSPEEWPPSIDASIQRFEFCYELAWKNIQARLFVVGIEVKSPREAFKIASIQGWVDDEQLWIDMIEDRNRTSHTYKAELASEMYRRLRDYLPALEALYHQLDTHRILYPS
jgi:nucleotidyltransferase substrate binding protein (TIGR01987 family)